MSLPFRVPLSVRRDHPAAQSPAALGRYEAIPAILLAGTEAFRYAHHYAASHRTTSTAPRL
jgi:hypothetical protein